MKLVQWDSFRSGCVGKGDLCQPFEGCFDLLLGTARTPGVLSED